MKFPSQLLVNCRSVRDAVSALIEAYQLFCWKEGCPDSCGWECWHGRLTKAAPDIPKAFGWHDLAVNIQAITDPWERRQFRLSDDQASWWADAHLAVLECRNRRSLHKTFPAQNEDATCESPRILHCPYCWRMVEAHHASKKAYCREHNLPSTHPLLRRRKRLYPAVMQIRGYVQNVLSAFQANTRNVATPKEEGLNAEDVLCQAVSDSRIFPELSSLLAGAAADMGELWQKLEGKGEPEFWTACWSATLCEAWLQVDKATTHGGLLKEAFIKRNYFGNYNKMILHKFIKKLNT